MAFHDSFWEGNGYSDLRKYMKSSEDFCKDASSIFTERMEIAVNHQKALAKLAAKASKLSSKAVGTLKTGWDEVVTSINTEADLHKTLGEQIQTQVIRPLRTRYDEMYKERKAAELAVEKSLKSFNDRRSKETSSRNASINRAKEVEALYESMESGTKTEKETAKISKQLKKAEELAAKTEKEYRRDCIEGDRLRCEWEASTYTFCRKMEESEHAKTNLFRETLTQYQESVLANASSVQECFNALGSSLSIINAEEDTQHLSQTKGTGPNVACHYLYHCYAEDMSAKMNEVRRLDALRARCNYFYSESRRNEQFRKGMEASSGLKDNQEEMAKINASIDYCQVSLYKLRLALAEVEGSQQPEHSLSGCIETKQVAKGQNISVLCVPLTDGIFRTGSEDLEEMDFDMVEADQYSSSSAGGLGFRRESSRSTSSSLGVRMGRSPSRTTPNSSIISSTHHSPVVGSPVAGGDDFDDDFDDQDDDGLGTATALYDFDAAESSELSIHAGDVIQVLAKEGVGDGWWEGVLNGQRGVFPADYVTQD